MCVLVIIICVIYNYSHRKIKVNNYMEVGEWQKKF